MANNAIKLVNEDGRIVGKDPSSGDTIPVDFEAISAEELNNANRPDPDDNQSGIEAADESGAMIVLEPQSEYLVQNPPLEVTSDDVTLRGPTSATIKVADDTIQNNGGKSGMEVFGQNVTLDGWTFDGNEPAQPADDTFGIWFDPAATEATVKNMEILRATGDAIGEIRPGSTVRDCRMEDFTEDAVDVLSTDPEKFVTIDNIWAKGNDPIKINANDGTIGNINITNSTLIGDGTPAISIEGVGTMENIRIINCDLDEENTNKGTIRFRDGPFKEIVVDDCYISSANDSSSVEFESGENHENIKILSSTLESDKGVHIDLQESSSHRIKDCSFVGSANLNIDFDANTEAIIESDQDLDINDESEGARVVLNGSGTNEGDPSSTGEWNGHGRQGMEVYDTTSGRPYDKYVYIDGAWQAE